MGKWRQEIITRFEPLAQITPAPLTSEASLSGFLNLWTNKFSLFSKSTSSSPTVKWHWWYCNLLHGDVLNNKWSMHPVNQKYPTEVSNSYGFQTPWLIYIREANAFPLSMGSSEVQRSLLDNIWDFPSIRSWKLNPGLRFSIIKQWHS